MNKNWMKYFFITIFFFTSIYCFDHKNGSLLADEKKLIFITNDQSESTPPPKPVAKVATPAQRERVHVGDFLTYQMTTTAIALGVNFDYQLKMTVTAIVGDEYTILSEVIKGTPPPDLEKKSESKSSMADLDDFSKIPKIGKVKEESNNGNTFKTEHLSNELIEINGKKIDCLVISVEGDLSGQGVIKTKQWYCITGLPISGLYKNEMVQTMAMPNGGIAVVKGKQELIDWKRANK